MSEGPLVESNFNSFTGHFPAFIDVHKALYGIESNRTAMCKV